MAPVIAALPALFGAGATTAATTTAVAASAYTGIGAAMTASLSAGAATTAGIGASLSSIATGVSLAGGVISAYGQYRAGQAAEATAKYNADLSVVKALQAEKVSERKTRRLIANQVALYGKAGVQIGEGSPLLIMAEEAELGKEESLGIRYSGAMDAKAERAKGKNLKNASFIKAGSTMLTSLGKAGTSVHDQLKTKKRGTGYA